MAVNLTRAPRAQAPMLQNLAQLYTHDFSEFWIGTAKGELNRDGRFEPYPLEPYFTLTNWSASLIWSDNSLAGFALVNDQAHSGEFCERNVGEFFILRKFRGQGVGRAAAHILFAQQPGSWEVAVARKNHAAYEFWRKTILSAVQVSELRELDLAGEHWNGPVFRFEWLTRNEPPPL
jgi:predicted acetyltransferase